MCAFLPVLVLPWAGSHPWLGLASFRRTEASGQPPASMRPHATCASCAHPDFPPARRPCRASSCRNHPRLAPGQRSRWRSQACSFPTPLMERFPPSSFAQGYPTSSPCQACPEGTPSLTRLRARGLDEREEGWSRLPG